MRIIIIDTNIVFSTLLNAQSNLGEVLFNNNDKLEFYSSEQLRIEIDRHKDKLLQLAKIPQKEINEVLYQVYKRIHFISDQQIPYQNWAEAAPLLRDIDMDDLPFVALTSYLDGFLWTGDMKLLNGLRAKGYQKCISTNELIDLIKT